jgi:CubicO group peptidase (beta-lactamase class C family)
MPIIRHRSRAITALSVALALYAVTALDVARAGAQSSIAPPARFAAADREARLRRAIPAVDSVMRAFQQRARVPGIAYGLVVDGRLFHVAAHGIRDTRGNAPVDTSSVYRIASMTKSFTALAILQLRDAGRLSLDDPAERYQQLDASEEDLSRMIRAGIPFSTAPGTAYEYSNFGFAILGRIVVNVGGMPYARYIRERVLLPLGMTSTTMEAKDVPANRLAHGYRLQDGNWLEEPPLPDGSFGAMGGMLTSSADLSRWVALMLDAWPPRDGAESPVLKRSSLREMQQIGRFNLGGASFDRGTSALSMNVAGYGYGLGISQNCLFGHVVAHSGGLPGFGSQMRWLPEYGVGIIALGNLTYTGWGGPITAAFEVLAREGALAPRAVQPAPVLLAMQEQVTRLVQRWQQPLADSIAAMNLVRDEAAPRRAAQIARLVEEAGGDCRADGTIQPENALRGQWVMRCATGALAVGITLAPTEPARVQALSVRPLPSGRLAAPQRCVVSGGSD